MKFEANHVLRWCFRKWSLRRAKPVEALAEAALLLEAPGKSVHLAVQKVGDQVQQREGRVGNQDAKRQ